jgi:hypothetical protein
MRKLFLFAALLFVLDGAIALQAVPQREGAATQCDNDTESGKRGVDHKCACERTETPCKTKPDDVAMSGKCKTYCKPEHCKCTNEKCS